MGAMGADLMRDGMGAYEAVEAADGAGEVSDEVAFALVVQVLDSVRMAPLLVAPNDRDQYDFLLNTVDPVRKMDSDQEALLETTLKALSGAVSKIDAMYHGALLNNIFSMCVWNYHVGARVALLGLITRLAAVADKYLEGCLHMIVSNFLPPERLIGFMNEPRWITRKKEIHNQLLMALNHITESVPFAPMKLKDIIDRSMPKFLDKKAKIVIFAECMLRLEKDIMGDILGSTLLAKVVDLLTDLDVNISWEDILQEEHSKGIFDMELEDLVEDEDKLGKDGTKAIFGGNAFAAKLDGLMVIVCEHLKSSADDGRLLKEFNILMDIFWRSILRLHKSKFAQFVMFYACSLDPETCGLNFAVLLTEIFTSKAEDPISRMSAVSYLGSYLSRAKFISSSIVASILQRLVDWCRDYCQFQNSQEKTFDPRCHQIFYAGCQAVMYVLCFRMRSIMDFPELKSQLFRMRLGGILSHPLEPLQVCLPAIVQEFLRQAKAAGLFNASVPSIYENAIESNFSKAFGGLERLDMFFPFDPYLLKESDRYMRPNFEFWSMVKTTYSSCNSDDEAELDDLDEPELKVGNFDDHADVDINSDDDNLEFSMNKMSITPKRAFHSLMTMNWEIPSQMPARIRPSVSPPS